MSLVEIHTERFKDLKNKVVVITGATTGIGAVVVSQLSDIGAKVVFGDIKEPDDDQLIANPNVKFVKTDVAEYASVLALFKAAWDAHGQIDHAISNAGLVEIGQLFDTGIDDSTIEESPPTLVLDVNLKGSLFFTRVAVHFLRKSLKTHASQSDASILLMGSVAGFEGFQGLFQYSATKHGVYGLFRTTRQMLSSTEGIRMNLVLPNMTRTAMVTGVIALFESLDVPCNEPKDVADTMIHAIATEADGEALYVSGTKTYEIEKRLENVKSEWLGDNLYQELLAGQAALGGGANWTKRKGGHIQDYSTEREFKC